MAVSVLACNRGDCENVMCDRLILGNSAYICNSCFIELVDWRKEWPDCLTKADVRRMIEWFMESPVGSYAKLHADGEEDEIEKEFRYLTGGA